MIPASTDSWARVQGAKGFGRKDGGGGGGGRGPSSDTAYQFKKLSQFIYYIW